MGNSPVKLNCLINSALLLFKILPSGHYSFVHFCLNPVTPGSSSRAADSTWPHPLSSPEGGSSAGGGASCQRQEGTVISATRKPRRTELPPEAPLPAPARSFQVSPKPQEGDLYCSARCLARRLLRLPRHRYRFVQLPRAVRLPTSSATLYPSATLSPGARPRSPAARHRAAPT